MTDRLGAPIHSLGAMKSSGLVLERVSLVTGRDRYFVQRFQERERRLLGCWKEISAPVPEVKATELNMENHQRDVICSPKLKEAGINMEETITCNQALKLKIGLAVFGTA